MPRLPDDALLNRAINLAALDRVTFADSLPHNSEERQSALALAHSIHTLRGKRLASLTEQELMLACKTFILAEQWESGFADTNPGQPYERKARKYQALFREVRLRRWGPTQMEADIAGASSVSVLSLKP
jgi:hypothetical protein